MKRSVCVFSKWYSLLKCAFLYESLELLVVVHYFSFFACAHSRFKAFATARGPLYFLPSGEIKKFSEPPLR